MRLGRRRMRRRVRLVRWVMVRVVWPVARCRVRPALRVVWVIVWLVRLGRRRMRRRARLARWAIPLRVPPERRRAWPAVLPQAALAVPAVRLLTVLAARLLAARRQRCGERRCDWWRSWGGAAAGGGSAGGGGELVGEEPAVRDVARFLPYAVGVTRHSASWC
ncbi:MAG: hypothetical protein R2715_09840 [Ilumatobacteraceae bacterium]